MKKLLLLLFLPLFLASCGEDTITYITTDDDSQYADAEENIYRIEIESSGAYDSFSGNCQLILYSHDAMPDLESDYDWDMTGESMANLDDVINYRKNYFKYSFTMPQTVTWETSSIYAFSLNIVGFKLNDETMAQTSIKVYKDDELVVEQEYNYNYSLTVYLNQVGSFDVIQP